MKTTIRKTVLSAVCALYLLEGRAERDLNQEFSLLYGMLGDSGMTQEAFLEEASRGGKGWYGHYVGSRTNMLDSAACGWFCSMANAAVPAGTEYWGAYRWLRTKSFAILSIGADDFAVRNDTNSWFAVSCAIGALRNGFRSEADWDAMRGVTSRTVDTNGVVFLCMPDLFSAQTRAREASVAEAKEMESLYRNFVLKTIPVFGEFSSSATMASFPPAERNTIVSNLVETARFTPDEAARLGLTNVVEQVGGVSP